MTPCFTQEDREPGLSKTAGAQPGVTMVISILLTDQLVSVRAQAITAQKNPTAAMTDCIIMMMQGGIRVLAGSDMIMPMALHNSHRMKMIASPMSNSGRLMTI